GRDDANRLQALVVLAVGGGQNVTPADAGAAVLAVADDGRVAARAPLAGDHHVDDVQTGIGRAGGGGVVGHQVAGHAPLAVRVGDAFVRGAEDGDVAGGDGGRYVARRRRAEIDVGDVLDAARLIDRRRRDGDVEQPGDGRIAR